MIIKYYVVLFIINQIPKKKLVTIVKSNKKNLFKKIKNKITVVTIVTAYFICSFKLR